jgi:hypothetical protein
MRALAALLLLQTLTIYVSPAHPYSLAYDPEVWKSDGSDEKDIDLVLTHRSGTVHAVVSAYAAKATLDELRAEAIENGRAVTPDLKVAAEERKQKDGADVLTMELRGTTAGQPVTYRGVYWTGGAKAIQLVATSTKETDADVKKLLDGLSIRVPKEDKRAFTIDFSPVKWQVRDDGSKDGTMLFAHSAGDTMALASASHAVIAPGGLREFVLSHAKVLAPDAKVVSEQPKTVAGHQVTMMQLEGTSTDGVPEIMLGYFLHQNGTYVEAVTFTVRERFPQRKADMLELLDGLQIRLPRE